MSADDILQADANFADNALLRQALVVTEVAFDLKERHTTGEKYINYLKILINGRRPATSFSCICGQILIIFNLI